MHSNQQEEVLVLYLSIENFNLELQERGFKLLPDSIKARVDRFKKEDDRRTRLASFLSLRTLYRMLGEDYEPLPRIALAEKGRPYIPDAPDFNWSHSGNLVVNVSSRRCRVGVDIEMIREVNFNIFKRYLHPDDWSPIEKSIDPNFDFLRTWTRTESTLKADGRGIFATRPKLFVGIDQIRLDGEKWFLKPLNLPDGYVGTLVTNSPSVKVNMFEVSVESLLD